MDLFWKKAVLQNVWLWAHLVGGALIALALLKIWSLSTGNILLMVLGIAVAWEIAEAVFTDIDKIYGSMLFFLYDAIGDVCGALLCAALLLWLFAA